MNKYLISTIIGLALLTSSDAKAHRYRTALYKTIGSQEAKDPSQRLYCSIFAGYTDIVTYDAHGKEKTSTSTKGFMSAGYTETEIQSLTAEALPQGFDEALFIQAQVPDVLTYGFHHGAPAERPRKVILSNVYGSRKTRKGNAAKALTSIIETLCERNAIPNPVPKTAETAKASRLAVILGHIEFQAFLSKTIFNFENDPIDRSMSFSTIREAKSQPKCRGNLKNLIAEFDVREYSTPNDPFGEEMFCTQPFSVGKCGDLWPLNSTKSISLNAAKMTCKPAP